MASGTVATKFQVADVPARRFDFKEHKGNDPNRDLIKHSSQYRRHKCTEVLQSTPFSSHASMEHNGFVDTVVDCYNLHRNLSIRPDDVWAAIMIQFSFYVNKNAEELRSKFVSFEGKKELEIEIPGTLRATPYDLFVKLMSKEIDKNLVDPELKAWVLPNFSTTTDNDLVSLGVIFMATVKSYFEFTCNITCGIPFITLEGSVEDWISVHSRLEKLKEYGLGKWYSMLEPILKQFVRAKQGKVDRDFWRKICQYENEMSGVYFVSGWITAFCVFSKHGYWQESEIKQKMFDEEDDDYSVVVDGRWPRINTRNIPTGIVEVNVKIKEQEREYKSIMFAGHMASEVMEDGVTLKPTLGWAIALKEN